MADINWITQAAGQPQAAGIVTLLTGQYTQFLDTTKPIGVIINLDAAGQPTPIAFVPVKNLQGLLGLIGPQVGEVTDVGNGIKQLQGPQPVFLKEASGFVFLSDKSENLGNVPSNPVAQLSGLEGKYNVAVSITPSSIPDQARQQWLQQMRSGFEAGLQNVPEDQRAQLSTSFDQVEQLLTEAEQMIIGFAIDAAAKSVYLDLNLRAKAGTDLAEQMNALANAKTDFAGFNIPGSAAMFTFTSEVSETDQTQAKGMLQSGLKQLLAELDEDEDLPSEEARAAAKQVLQDFFAVMEKTIEEGVIDGGAVLMLDSGLQFAAGLRVADGKALDSSFRQLIELAKEEQEIPEVRLNAATHGDVTFHAMTIPVDDQDAQQVLGENVELFLGTGPKSAWVAFGTDGLTLVNQVIDTSAQNQGKATTPVQLVVSLTPIIKFATQFDQDENLTRVLAALSQAQGKDHFSVSVNPEQNGFSYRFEIEEGVIRAIGAGAAGQAAGGAQGGGF
jgi:hypothetical protein